jgi:hydroxymethylbilane synthase
LSAAEQTADDRLSVEVVPIKTTGDRIKDRPLAEEGGKGLFVKEIETALLENQIDLAVHSMKDVPWRATDGLEIAAYLPRADVREVLITATGATLADLPSGGTVGTSSLRRQAQIMALRGDLRVEPIRGNVETRLRKVRDGDADATILALAGLTRLGMDVSGHETLSVEMLLPAVGQGAIGIQITAANASLHDLLKPINHMDTSICVEAERAYLEILDGSCHSPIAGLGQLGGNGEFHFAGRIMTPDGKERHEAERRGPLSEARALAISAAAEVRGAASAELLASFN